MAKVDVLTNRYDNRRTGATVNETVLNAANVHPNTFGKLFARTVDGQIYAQPLIVTGLAVPGRGTVDVVYVCTSRNNVYAFDAEDPAAGVPLWQVNLGPTVPRTDYGGGYRDFSSEVGITATPAIDRAAGTLFVAAKTKFDPVTQPNGTVTAATYAYQLHALDLATGAEKPPGPAVIAQTVVHDLANQDNARNFTFVSGPSVRGTAEGSVGGTLTFNAFFEHNRPGLLLLDGVVYLAFASQGDKGIYHGWVLAYDAVTLGPLGAYCTTPDWGEGGIWQSGCGLAGDTAGEVFAVVGNGRPTEEGQPNPDFAAGPFFGQNVLKLSLNRATKTLSLADWFTPFDVQANNVADLDLCAGPVLLPWGNLVGGFGKDRAYYILHRGDMGRFTPGRNAIAQFAPGMTSPLNDPNDPNAAGGTGHIHCAPVVFTHPTLGPISYVWGENDDLRGYRFDTATMTFETTPGPNLKGGTAAPLGMPGGMLAISSDGVNAASALVWAAHPADENANNKVVAGVLQAFAADDLTQPLWRSNHDPLGTDDVGLFAKFNTPVVANGKVYLATFSNELIVYGLVPAGGGTQPIGPWSQADVPPAVPPGTPIPADDPQLFRVEGSASFSCNRFTILGAGHDIWGDADGFHYVYQAVSNGTVTITARIMSVSGDISPWSKARVMIRQTLDPASVNAAVLVTPGNGVVFQFRDAAGGPTGPVVAKGTQVGVKPGGPIWVRLTRAPAAGGGFSLVGFASANGVAWTQVGGPATIPMPAVALAGLAVSAHNDGATPNPLEELCVAVVDKVTLA